MKTILFILLVFASTSFAQPFQWYINQNSPISINKNEDIYFIDDNTGYLTHNDTICSVFKTTDGGINWISIYSSETFFRSITFINDKTGWLGALNKEILLSTTDGGVNWSKVNFIGEEPKGICSLFKLNEQYIFGCGKYTGPPHFIKTTNGGTTWNSYNLSEYATCLIDCYFLNKDSGFVVGGVGDSNFYSCSTVILFTSNGGITWKQVYRNSVNENIAWKIYATDSNFFQVSIQSFKGHDTVEYLTSVNKGQSWSKYSFKCDSPIFESLGICFLNPTTGFVSGIRRNKYRKENGEVYYTTDGGLTWGSNYSLININRFRKINEHCIVATGQQFYKLSY